MTRGKGKDKSIIPTERIVGRIFLVRDQRVMIDRDLAELYDVDTRTLNQAVRRNVDRFPSDFMFQLNKAEFQNWKSQIVISNGDKMGLRKPPLAFTELGVAMLSGVLNSPRAIQVHIAIIRAFSQLREMLASHKEILRRLERNEKQIVQVMTLFQQLLDQPKKPKGKMGFQE